MDKNNVIKKTAPYPVGTVVIIEYNSPYRKGDYLGIVVEQFTYNHNERGYKIFTGYSLQDAMEEKEFMVDKEFYTDSVTHCYITRAGNESDKKQFAERFLKSL